MKHISIFCLFFFLLTSMSANGQASGFMGQRFFVEGRVGADILWINLIAGLDGSSELPEFVSVSSSISLNYVLSRYHYLGLEANNHSYKRKAFIDLNSGVEELRFQIEIKSYGLGYYSTSNGRNNEGTLAPLGSFLGYKLTYNQLRISPFAYSESGDVFEGDDLETYERFYENPSVNFVGFDIVYGLRTIIKKKITLSAAIESGFSIAKLSEYYSGDGQRPIFEDELDEYLRFYVNFNLGVGYLLF